jgi:glycosyltransferase involved in cell wall biosynthesis
LGQYIAFHDSDDIWLPGKLQRQMDLLLSLPSRIGVVTASKIIYGRDSNFVYGIDRVAIAPSPETLLQTDGNQVAQLLTENRLSVQNALFRRTCYPGSDWFDSCARANEDWEFAIRLAQHTTIYEEQMPVVLGFVSPDSISRSSRKEIIGHLRIVRKNRAILNRLRGQRSALLLGLSKSLYHQGKRKSALKFLLAGLRDRPTNLGSVLTSLLRMFTKKWLSEQPATIHD